MRTLEVDKDLFVVLDVRHQVIDAVIDKRLRIIQDALLVIDLPEDDATVLGTAEAVAIRGGQHLALVQIACRDHGLTEYRIHREAL